jgi:TRADD-N domain-containing protein
MAEKSKLEFERTCAELSDEIEKGSLGAVYAKHQKLIMQYYVDVQDQAQRSFAIAAILAVAGFLVLIGTLGVVGWHSWGDKWWNQGTFAAAGVVSGFAMEYVAKIAFDLYARCAKQFGAFHICLERTHRYLLAYKIADRMGDTKQQTFRDLVCIMANAPMISDRDVGLPEPGKELNKVNELLDSLQAK